MCGFSEKYSQCDGGGEKRTFYGSFYFYMKKYYWPFKNFFGLIQSLESSLALLWG